jgi:hypothetical protein
MKCIRYIRGSIDDSVNYGVMCGTDEATGLRKKKLQKVKPQEIMCM